MSILVPVLRRVRGEVSAAGNGKKKKRTKDDESDFSYEDLLLSGRRAMLRREMARKNIRGKISGLQNTLEYLFLVLLKKRTAVCGKEVNDVW